MLDALPQLRRKHIAPARVSKNQRHKDEIGAIMAILDDRQHCLDHRLGILPALPERQTCKRADGISLGMVRDFGEGFGDTVLKRGRRLRPAGSGGKSRRQAFDRR